MFIWPSSVDRNMTPSRMRPAGLVLATPAVKSSARSHESNLAGASPALDI